MAQMVSQAKFHYQPLCGYSFHNLRSMLALFCGTIPVIHAPDFNCPQLAMHMDLLNLEHGTNCILVNSSPLGLVDAAEIIRDISATDQILKNIKEMDLEQYTSSAMSKRIWEVQK